ncbi:MAG: DUF4924 family protein [Bacteroidales bacterium]|nr:DUF4924 family protein [Bacteroidales bacterium]
MIIANKKKKENIAEYILYMYQIEDLIRAFNFDLDKLEQNVFGSFTQDKQKKKEIREWYGNLIQMMDLEQIKEKGHLQIVKNIVKDLDDLHKSLLNNPAEIDYQTKYHKAVPNIAELAAKMQVQNPSETEVMFHGLYTLILLRLRKQEITQETMAAMETFSSLLALLSQKYHEREKKERTEWM